MWMDFIRRRRSRKSSSSRREYNRRRQNNPQRRLFAEPLEERRLLTVVGHLANLEPPEGFVLTSGVPQDLVGKSVSSAGDVNRDGFDDLLIGAPVDDNFPAGNGAAYLIYIAVKTWRNARMPLPADTPATGRAFLSGFLVNLGNPKSVFFAAAVLVVVFPPVLTGSEKLIIFANHLTVELIVQPMLAVLLSTRAISRLGSNDASNLVHVAHTLYQFFTSPVLS